MLIYVLFVIYTLLPSEVSFAMSNNALYKRVLGHMSLSGWGTFPLFAQYVWADSVTATCLTECWKPSRRHDRDSTVGQNFSLKDDDCVTEWCAETLSEQYNHILWWLCSKTKLSVCKDIEMHLLLKSSFASIYSILLFISVLRAKLTRKLHCWGVRENTCEGHCHHLNGDKLHP